MPSFAPPPTANHSGGCFSNTEYFQKMIQELKTLRRALVQVGGVPQSVAESLTMHPIEDDWDLKLSNRSGSYHCG